MIMKNLIRIVVGVLAASSLPAAPLKSAVVSIAVNDVKISESSKEARTANTGQSVGVSSTVLTGRESRAELGFPDKTITRIGANSVFRFSSGSRDMEIEKGSFLLQVPKNSGGANIRTATVTAAITGTTTMMEYSPGQWVKFICLEGEAELSNKFNDKVTIRPGMMIVMNPDAKKFPQPVFVNLQKLIRTSVLMDRKVFGNLNAPARSLINRAVSDQMGERRGGELIPSGVVIRGSGFRDNGSGGEGGPGENGGGTPRALINGKPSSGGTHPDRGGAGGNPFCFDTQGNPIPDCTSSPGGI